mgnify:CR=1 FL=1
MSGIYIHVPYCKQKCEYCDFYSVVTNEGKQEFSDLLIRELSLRMCYLPNSRIETIYFGGGTPSLLSAMQVEEVINAIAKQFELVHNAEITFEANPDDLDTEYLGALRHIGINRLSIGIQSFSDTDLRALGRRHNATQAVYAVNSAQEVGFSNISIDLIYGLPYSNTGIWHDNLMQAFSLQVQHLSCYHLIYESGTPITRRLNSGVLQPASEDQSVEQFKLLQEVSQQKGFVHYEISNLAQEGFFSRHNSSYWKQIPYLGIGPSSHSFNGVSRDWNPRSIAKWKKMIRNGSVALESEALSPTDMVNDYILTSLRTIWGLDVDFIEKKLGFKALNNFLKAVEKYEKLGFIKVNRNEITIKPQYFLLSDGIIADLLFVT